MRFAAGVLAVAMGALFGVAQLASPAFASGCDSAGDYCEANYYGLYIVDQHGTIQGGIDYTAYSNNWNKKIFNDPYGDRQWVQAPLRDRSPGNGDAVYVQWDWYKNGSFCYVNQIGVSAGPSQGGVTIGYGCSSGWNYWTEKQSTRIQDSNWWFMSAAQGVDPASNSLRVSEKGCQDEAWVPDECSGVRLLGISY